MTEELDELEKVIVLLPTAIDAVTQAQEVLQLAIVRRHSVTDHYLNALTPEDRAAITPLSDLLARNRDRVQRAYDSLERAVAALGSHTNNALAIIAKVKEKARG